MRFFIQLTDRAEDDFKDLSHSIAKRIAGKINEIRKSEDPMYFAKALTGTLKGLYRFRIGDYRVIFKKESDGTLIILLILRIKHRKEVYE